MQTFSHDTLLRSKTVQRQFFPVSVAITESPARLHQGKSSIRKKIDVFVLVERSLGQKLFVKLGIQPRKILGKENV